MLDTSSRYKPTSIHTDPFEPGIIEMNSICEHKEQIGCALTALPRCCSCADKRPVATAYPIYVDGKGMKLQGKRWQRYCWKCRGRHEFLTFTLLCFHFFIPSHSKSLALLTISHSLIDILLIWHQIIGILYQKVHRLARYLALPIFRNYTCILNLALPIQTT